MDELYCIFPARQPWPPATDDVAQAPAEANRIRLVSGARNLERLPLYRNLKALWCFDINDDKLRAICACTSLESLYIENIKAEHLDGLSKLPNLRILGLESCSRIASLDSFSGLRSLSGLGITHFKSIRALGPLAGLTSLRALAVSGSMWTKMQVESFRPLAELQHLEFLHLTNIKPENESLKPLAELKALKQLDLANFYPMTEFAWLSKQLTTTECTWFRPYIEMKHMECTKCRKFTMVMLTGKRKPTLCKQCDKKALEKHLHDWNVAVERAA